MLCLVEVEWIFKKKKKKKRRTVMEEKKGPEI